MPSSSPETAFSEIGGQILTVVIGVRPEELALHSVLLIILTSPCTGDPKTWSTAQRAPFGLHYALDQAPGEQLESTRSNKNELLQAYF